jgi:hypothetical protein
VKGTVFLAIGCGIMVAAAFVAATQPPQTTPPPSTPPASGTLPPVAQLPPASPPPAQPAAAPAPRQFTADAGMIFNAIKPDKVADFEKVMARVKEALTKSSDAKRKQQAAGWRVFKSLEPGPGGSVLYVFWFDPPVKEEDYSVSTILAEAFPNEVQDLWKTYVDCFVGGQTMVNLQLTTNMSATATAVK